MNIANASRSYCFFAHPYSAFSLNRSTWVDKIKLTSAWLLQRKDSHLTKANALTDLHTFGNDNSRNGGVDGETVSTVVQYRT